MFQCKQPRIGVSVSVSYTHLDVYKRQPLVISSTLLFLAGIAFCYFFVFGQVFAFIASFAPKSITPAPDIEAYLSFVLTMFAAFGLAFEVPVALVVMAVSYTHLDVYKRQGQGGRDRRWRGQH